MIEFYSKPLVRGSPIHVIIDDNQYKVTWRKVDSPLKGEISFQFPFCFICKILKDFFVDDEWYPLGADHAKTRSKDLANILLKIMRVIFQKVLNMGQQFQG